MLKQTIQLFIKATIVGILINFGLEQVPAKPLTATEDTVFQEDIIFQNEASSFQQSSTESELNADSQ